MEDLMRECEEKAKELMDFICNYKGKNVYKTKKFWELLKEKEKMAIDFNKKNNLYYEEKEWIYTEFTKIQSSLPFEMTGNELTKAIALKLSEYNGILLQEIFENNKTNYLIYVVTPYAYYIYKLFRGYDKICTLEPYKACGTNKFKYNIKASKNLFDLIFERRDNKEFLKENIFSYKE